MKVKACVALTRASIMDFMQFRLSVFVMLFGNIIYLIVIYNLWRAIYASVDNAVINGMSFNDTMIYLVLASAQFTFMEAYLVWMMGRAIQSGKIVLDLLKPVSYTQYLLFRLEGGNLCGFVFTFIPTFIIVQIITKGAIHMGINILFYLASALLGMLINFAIDFIIGTVCLYTQSIWGINIMKEVVVLFLSGATVPLAFFPPVLKSIALFLPFHSIYNTPLTFLTKGQELGLGQSFMLLGEQLFWVVILLVIGKIFWKLSERIITVNGG
ncbi:MAG: ABC-2 family transporter protein [Lachnospiraceae bacterium]|nr:ABC-2 family transporter protein [Lachnospiraceae bacterium]